MRRIAILTTLVAAFAGAARAESCPPSVRLDGDPALVTAIARELSARGISVALDEHCPSVRANVALRGTQLVVVIDTPDGASNERTLNEVSTATTVIESFTRTDVSLPLLATRTIHTAPSGPLSPSPPPGTEQALLGSVPDQRVHLALTASLESSFASDGTTWAGRNFKVCIELGPVCAAARLRSSQVVAGFGSPGIERDHNELLIGVDVPFALGRLQLAPGFAGGVGRMETRVAGMKHETGGFVAEAHVSLSVPIVYKFAIEVAIGAVLGDYDPTSGMASAEPAFAFRAGVGLRYRR